MQGVSLKVTGDQTNTSDEMGSKTISDSKLDVNVITQLMEQFRLGGNTTSFDELFNTVKEASHPDWKPESAELRKVKEQARNHLKSKRESSCPLDSN